MRSVEQVGQVVNGLSIRGVTIEIYHDTPRQQLLSIMPRTRNMGAGFSLTNVVKSVVQYDSMSYMYAVVQKT